MTNWKTDWSIGHRGKNSIQSELQLDCPTRDRSNRPIKNSILCGHWVIQSHWLAASIDQPSIRDSLRSDRISQLGLQSPSLRLWFCILNMNPLCSFRCICTSCWLVRVLALQFCDVKQADRNEFRLGGGKFLSRYPDRTLCPGYPNSQLGTSNRKWRTKNNWRRCQIQNSYKEEYCHTQRYGRAFSLPHHHLKSGWERISHTDSSPVQQFKNRKETNPIRLLGCSGMAEWAKSNKIWVEKAKQYSLHFYWPIPVQGYKLTALGCDLVSLNRNRQ